MVTLTEGKHEGEFVGELAMGIGFHVDQVTLLSGQNLPAGRVVGIVTASGKFVEYDDDGTDDGRRIVAGVLMAACDASGADVTTARVLRRGPAIINKNDISFAAGVDAGEQATAIAALLTVLGIKAV